MPDHAPTWPVMSEQGTYYLANKAGLSGVEPGVVVDCTGDADIAARAGAPVEKAAELQPMSLHFRIGNVRPTPDIRQGCREAVIRAQERGDLPMFYGPGVGFRFAPDEVYVHAIRVRADGTDPEDLPRAEMQGRADAWAMFEAWQREMQGRADAWAMFEAWQREVPGFEDAYFIISSTELFYEAFFRDVEHLEAYLRQTPTKVSDWRLGPKPYVAERDRGRWSCTPATTARPRAFGSSTIAGPSRSAASSRRAIQ